MADAKHGVAWRKTARRALERYLEDDVVRGLAFTDAKIGVFTHAHEETLLQNRCFLYHLIGNKTGEWKVPVGGMGKVWDPGASGRSHGAELLTRVDLRHLNFSRKNPSNSKSTVGRRRSKRASFSSISG